MPLHHIPLAATGEAPDASPFASGATLARIQADTRQLAHDLLRVLAAAHATVAQDGAR